jgi:hypothetical protein
MHLFFLWFCSMEEHCFEPTQNQSNVSRRRLLPSYENITNTTIGFGLQVLHIVA